MKRYSYRMKGGAMVISDYAAKAPATSSLYQHIRYVSYQEARKAENWSGGSLSDKEVKEIAARDYELVTYVLVEESELKSLQESSAWLCHLENAGVDNWEGISFAYELQREAGEGED